MSTFDVAERRRFALVVDEGESVPRHYGTGSGRPVCSFISNAINDRLMDEYELGEGLGAELEHRWTRREDRPSLRALAEYFDRQLLRAVLESTTSTPSNGVENLSRLLTDDDVTSGVRRETRSRPERRGVDELVNAGRLTLGDSEITVSVHVHCADCETRVSAIGPIERGGCQCRS